MKNYISCFCDSVTHRENTMNQMDFNFVSYFENALTYAHSHTYETYIYNIFKENVLIFFFLIWTCVKI